MLEIDVHCNDMYAFNVCVCILLHNINWGPQDAWSSETMEEDLKPALCSEWVVFYIAVISNWGMPGTKCGHFLGLQECTHLFHLKSWQNLKKNIQAQALMLLTLLICSFTGTGSACFTLSIWLQCWLTQWPKYFLLVSITLKLLITQAYNPTFKPIKR